MNKMHRVIPLCAIAFLAVAIASPEGAKASTTSGVSSAGVTKGRLAVETRLGLSMDSANDREDRRLRTRAQVDYGVTDYYAARLVITGDKRKGDTHELDAITFDNRFQITDAKESGLDFGVRFAAIMKDGDKTPHGVQFRTIQVVPYDEYEFRSTQIFDHEVGENSVSGLAFELRNQATVAWSADTRIGVESYHDFGNLRQLSGYDDQSHELGPVLKFKLEDGVSIETGYRAGISRGAPDHNFKIFVGQSF